jgi:hypothetical protein
MLHNATLTAAVDVFVPRPGGRLAVTIDARSGIVGTPIREWFKNDGEDPEDAEDGILVIDYEGNRFGAANIRTYADRVMQAAGRHAVHYPTVARQTVPGWQDELLRVGVYVPNEKQVNVADDESMAHLATWLGVVIGSELYDNLRCT